METAEMSHDDKPCEVTDSMIMAGIRYYNRLEHVARQGHPRVEEVVRGIFQAMMAAAPSSPSASVAIPTKLTPTESQGHYRAGHTDGWNACVDTMLATDRCDP